MVGNELSHVFFEKLFVLILYVLVCGSRHVKPEAGVEAPSRCFRHVSLVCPASCPSPLLLFCQVDLASVRRPRSGFCFHVCLHASAVPSQSLCVYSKS